ARGDGHGGSVPKPDVTLHISRAERLLQPANVKLGKRMGAAQSRARVPDTARVDQQRGTVANPFTRATNQFDVEPFVPAHRFPAELDGLVACLDPAAADFGSLLAVTAEENRRVRLDTVMLFASEQPMDGLLKKLS